MSDRQHAADALVVLRRRVDTHFAQAVARSPGELACRAGCDSCCRPGLSVFAIEADAIAAALQRLPPPLRARVRQAAAVEAPQRCALLVDGECSVYDARPLLCRSHGLAVTVPTETRQAGGVAWDHCALNYRGAPPPAASILDVDAVNAPLSVMARMWGGERVALADLARAPSPRG